MTGTPSLAQSHTAHLASHDGTLTGHGKHLVAHDATLRVLVERADMQYATAGGLRADVNALRHELAELRREFDEFRRTVYGIVE
mgnify:CR=1 FL=1